MVPLAHQDLLPSFHEDWGNWMRFLILCPKFKRPLNVQHGVKNAITVNVLLVTSQSILAVWNKNVISCPAFLVTFLACSIVVSFLVIKTAEKPVLTECKGSSPSDFTGFYLKQSKARVLLCPKSPTRSHTALLFYSMLKDCLVNTDYFKGKYILVK